MWPLLTPQLSIIIPTYNRKEVLLKALEGYKQQTAREQILELLVVDDGSMDGTGLAVAAFSQTSPIRIRYLAEQNKGPATARNLGIREAKSTLVLFSDDDIIPQPTLVAEHTAWHRKYPADNFAILGHVRWSPEVHPTPFMEWLGLGGGLFSYGFLSPGTEVSTACFYSCNISLKREFLIKNGMFDENFHAAAFEDTELGYRLLKKGLRLVYNSEAIGEHYRHLSYADVCRLAGLACAAGVHLETTEGGRYLKDQASPAKPIAKRVRLRKAMAKVIAPLLVPLTPLLDTQVQLPWFVYRILYYHHIVPKAHAKFERRRARREDGMGT